MKLPVKDRTTSKAAWVRAGKRMRERLAELIDTFCVFAEDGVVDDLCAYANIEENKRAVAAWDKLAKTEEASPCAD